jgi:hypothetical protein
MASIYGTEKSILRFEAGGAIVEGLTALAAGVLAILGIVGLVPTIAASIATLLLGAAFLEQGTALASEYSKLLNRLGGGSFAKGELAVGTTAEFVIGGAAVTLGILSLVNIYPMVLLPCSVIAIGAALVLTSGSAMRLNDLKLEAAQAGALAQNMAHATVSGAAGAQLLAGFATAVLGIIALVSGDYKMVLTLVGLLVSSAALTLSAGALSGRMLESLYNGRGTNTGPTVSE